MAIFTLIGGVIAGALGLGAATLFGVSVGSLIAGALAFGLQLGLSYLNRPKKRTYSAVQGQKEYGARVPVWTLYGTGKVQGHHIYYAKWGSGNAYNADVFILSNGWCDGLEPEIYFYGQKHTLVARPISGNEVSHYGVTGFDNLISIRFYDGRPGQGPDTKLVADTANIGQKWKATSVCAGMTYVVVERHYDSGKFDKGIPEFEFILRGLRLYDPRKDSTVAGDSGSHRLNDPSTWEFSENPALQRLNYQLGLRGQISGRTLIGEGKSLGQLDLGSYFAAMNACDALRNGKATYRASLLVTGEDDHTEVLKEFDDAMAGYGMNRRGLSGVIAGAPQIPVMDIGPDDVDAGRPVQIKRRKSAFELYNNIGGQFISKEANWNPESLKPVTINADVAADGRMRQTSNDFLQVTDPDIAQYLLQIRYRQNRKGGSATIPVSRRVGFNVEEGNWITYAGLTWLVTGWQMNSNLEFTLTLAETGSDVYSSSGIEPGPIVIPPTPPVNPSLLTTVQNFTVEVGMITGADGYEKPVLRMTWEPPEDPTITMVRFEYGVQGGVEKYTAQTAEVESGEFVTGDNVVPGEIYIARATIVTVPDRFKTWTGWAATSTATGAMAVTAYLRNVGQDVYQTLQSLRAEQAELRDRLEILAAGTADATGASSEMHTVTRKFRNATAIALREMTASIEAKTQVYRQPTPPTGDLVDGDIWIDTSADNFVRVWNATLGQWEDAGAKGLLTFAQPTAPTASNVGDLWIDTDDDNKLYRWSGTAWVDISDERITAQASIIDAVQAQVGEISADGLRKIEVVAGTGDVVARLVDMVRATIADDWVEAGTITEVGFTGGDPAKPFSRVIQYADQHVFADANGEWPPVVIDETGTGWFNRLRIKDLDATNITADKLDAAEVLQDGTLITDLLAFNAVTDWVPMQWSRYVSKPPNGFGYDDGGWITVKTVVIDIPANRPMIEFMNIRSRGYKTGGNGNITGIDLYTRIMRNGVLLLQQRLQTSSTGVAASSTTFTADHEGTITYEIMVWHTFGSQPDVQWLFEVVCDCGVLSWKK